MRVASSLARCSFAAKRARNTFASSRVDRGSGTSRVNHEHRAAAAMASSPAVAIHTQTRAVTYAVWAKTPWSSRQARRMAGSIGCPVAKLRYVTRMRHTARVSLSLLVGITACGTSSGDALNQEVHAVGTYIGGGSIFGSEPCTYEGGPAVFMPNGTNTTPSSTPTKGPRFVFAAGRIIKKCGDATTRITAVVPDNVVMTGSSKVKVGTTSEPFDAYLTGKGMRLAGDAHIEWSLGHDCTGIAEFAPTMGAQDTGGRDRFRRLIATGKGTCTLTVDLTIGSSLAPSFPGRTFETQRLISVE